MAGEIRQFNPGAANQLSDADYLSNSTRTDGLVADLEADHELHNKLFYQLTTMAKAFADVLTAKGATISDADLTVLTEAIRTSLNSSPIVSITGATTITYTGLNKLYVCSGSSNYTVTIPSAAASGVLDGSYLHFINKGTGTILLSGGGYTVYLYPEDEIKIYARPVSGSSAWYGQIKRPPTSGELSQSNTSATKTMDLGYVVAGERYEFRSYGNVSSGSSSLLPAGLGRIVHYKSSGDATILFGGEFTATWGALNMSTAEATGSHESIIKVTGSGSLIMASQIQLSYSSTPDYQHYAYSRRL